MCLKVEFNNTLFAKAIWDKIMDVQKEFGERIGLRKFAKEIGCSAPTLHRAVNKKKVDLDTAIKICHWLGCSVDDFVTKD